jgi:hypothetical protein
VRKNGVLSEDSGNGNSSDSENGVNEDDDDDEDEDDLSYYSPVIPISNKSLLTTLKHPKKSFH